MEPAKYSALQQPLEGTAGLASSGACILQENLT